jgi:hypothetical protein
MADPDPPIVYATPRHGQWVVTCPYCGREHVHAPAPGPRVAHCTGGEHREYVVRLAPSSAEGRDG